MNKTFQCYIYLYW